MFGIRFDEIFAMYKVKKQLGGQIAFRADQEDLKFCYDILKHVSRSFAAVIMQLNDELRDVICIFYLALRALDTIEDDMDVPVADKKVSLPVFHTHLEDDKWFMTGVGKGKERTLLEEFYRVSKEYKKLKPEYQEVISDITHKMAMGMCRTFDDTVQTTADYDLYCHYVAGLVGHGLTRIFAKSGIEDPHLADDLDMANNMGLFLQKANIIRDYYEDVMEDPPRLFWPKEIWGHFGETIFDFKDRANEARARECLHAMICDALRHVPDCIKYMSSIKDRSVFLFCAIPQVMAIATLNCLYNNYNTFHEKRKIRKGLTCKIILNCDTLDRALAEFSYHLEHLESMLIVDDPSYELTMARIKESKQLIAESRPSNKVVQSWARSFFTYYPALGGRVLYSLVDSMTGYFKKTEQQQ
eukprot:GILJ01007628.1.p1 GENE.GILJ01007628.1~~GILJ01007628.1.p1  ORF type:complete len:413 (+),score=68.27 GILJ01007628.1:40-1278(+)